MAKPPSNRIRLTISVSPETHVIFQRMADATGMSLGMTMGEWLDDTSEGAAMLAQKLEQARQSPKLVIREMQAVLVGMQDEMTGLMADLRSGKRVPPGTPGQAKSARAAAAAPSPRPVIRGGKSHQDTTKGHKPKGST
jgi:hypothetical protein